MSFGNISKRGGEVISIQKKKHYIYLAPEAFSAKSELRNPCYVTPKSSALHFTFWFCLHPTALSRITSPRESETFRRNVKGVRFWGAELQTAVKSQPLGHIRANFTQVTMITYI